MPNARIGDYFRVSKTPQNVKSSKRTIQELSPEQEKVIPESKKPACVRFSHLVSDAESPSPAPVVQKKITKPEVAVISKPPCTSASIRPKKKIVKVPAHQRFSYLVDETVKPIECPSDSFSSIKTARDSLLSEEVELTQTETTIAAGLVLPNHLRTLLELFRSCDTVVSMLHNRKELCSFDKLRPAVQEIVRRDFEESHVGQFLTVYPMVYFLRFEKQLDKFTRRPNGNYVLVLTPNLRTDGTQIGHDSPSKGFLPFSGTRLIQRRNRFHRLLLGLVLRIHREFLTNELGVDPAKLPDDGSLRRWHPRFRLDSAVPIIHPSPLPVHPSEFENKITSAKDAVKAFQARALFREADTCQKIAESRSMPVIPSPKKSSVASHKSVTVNNTEITKSVICQSTQNEDNLSSISTSTPNNLKGISQTLLNKVRARENERRLLAELTRSSVSEARRSIYCRLPLIITQVWSILRSASRPVAMATVATRVSDVHPSGLSPDVILDHLEVLLELAPDWIEKLSWVTAHLRLKNSDCAVKDVIDSVKEKIAKENVFL